MVFQHLLSHQQLSHTQRCAGPALEKERRQLSALMCSHVVAANDQRQTHCKRLLCGISAVAVTACFLRWHGVLTEFSNDRWACAAQLLCATVEYDLHRGVFHIKPGRLTLLNMSDMALPQRLFWEY